MGKARVLSEASCFRACAHDGSLNLWQSHMNGGCATMIQQDMCNLVKRGSSDWGHLNNNHHAYSTMASVLIMQTKKHLLFPPWLSSSCFLHLMIRFCYKLLGRLNLYTFSLADCVGVPITVQQDAMLYSLFIFVHCSPCFGWYLHPSSGAHTTVSTASGTCQTTATCR